MRRTEEENYRAGVTYAWAKGIPLDIWPGDRYRLTLEDLPWVAGGGHGEEANCFLVKDTEELLERLITGRKYGRLAAHPTGKTLVGEWIGGKTDGKVEVGI